jgi:hypothetical protein
MSLLYRPRIFDTCGHTMCEICMLKHDHSVLEQTNCSTQYPAFGCPICRASSLRRWFERPINVLVDQMVQTHPEYAERKREVDAEFDEWLDSKEADAFGVLRHPDDPVSTPDLMTIDLARVASRARAVKAREYYDLMMPVLCDAAAAGTCRVSFVANAREINVVAEPLARLLHRHGVHSLQSSARETTVFMTHDATSWSSEYINPTYDAEQVRVDENEFAGRYTYQLAEDERF